MEIKNTGQLTLTNVAAASSKIYVTTDCSTTANMAPGSSSKVSCVLTANAVQDDYDAGTLQIEVHATAGHMGLSSLSLSGTLEYSHSISLNNSASMDLVVSADPAPVTGTGAVSSALGTGRSQPQPQAYCLWYLCPL
jgi:hypothetical protein